MGGTVIAIVAWTAVGFIFGVAGHWIVRKSFQNIADERAYGDVPFIPGELAATRSLAGGDGKTASGSRLTRTNDVRTRHDGGEV